MNVDPVLGLIRDVPDFPKPGILFKDITPVLQDPEAFRALVLAFAEATADLGATRIVGIESRGFLLASALAFHTRLGLVIVRKPKKLPFRTRRVEYALEYGTDAVEMHEDAVGPGDRVLIVDDVLATGGTARAAGQLVTGAGATVAGYTFFLELGFLSGRDKLDSPVRSLVVL